MPLTSSRSLRSDSSLWVHLVPPPSTMSSRTPAVPVAAILSIGPGVVVEPLGARQVEHELHGRKLVRQWWKGMLVNGGEEARGAGELAAADPSDVR